MLFGAAAAIALAAAVLTAAKTLHDWPLPRSLFLIASIPLSAGIPTWLVGRVNPRLSRAHLLAYFATLMALFVVIGLLNMQFEM